MTLALRKIPAGSRTTANVRCSSDP